MENVMSRYHLEELGVDGWIISEWIFMKQVEMVWTGLI